MYQSHEWDLLKVRNTARLFSLQVCIAKCNSSPALESVLCQDLLLGEGQGVEGGDSLEVAYTGWLFQNNGLGQVNAFLPGPGRDLHIQHGAGVDVKRIFWAFMAL